MGPPPPNIQKRGRREMEKWTGIRRTKQGAHLSLESFYSKIFGKTTFFSPIEYFSTFDNYHQADKRPEGLGGDREEEEEEEEEEVDTLRPCSHI